MHPVPEFTLLNALAAIGIAFLYISLSSLLREPTRQQFNAIVIAGAGAAYLSNGLGYWEFLFCAILTWVAYRGLTSYRFIGLGWLLHTGWDLVHHVYAEPIVPFSPASSAGCAVCDTILAIWFWCGAPLVGEWIGRKKVINANT
ncbi:hypothetical protein SAMN05421823_107162 [Catalinimonas alkaloidigena]|uniref:Uncharacterized protein n=1 Tax=Catalinimonas alkaloidigena TaxID=1075417 RepID=A0A1G9LUY0_9BACT|nr:DUF6010 family protein [Catalinimonas alkaloidigena]SDL65235.1 hypothetical protein SAMN05421823_107162 [Catalinimonas alkaloidigena]